MTEHAQLPDSSPEDRLSYLRNRKIVVVDDAFDAPIAENLEEGAVADFFEEVASDSDVREGLAALAGAPIRERKDLVPDLIERLWQMKADETPIGDLCRRTLFALALDKLANVTPFCDHLRSLGLNVVELGQSGSVPTTGVGLVLVDYVLGAEVRTSIHDVETLRSVAHAVMASEALVRRFYHSVAKDEDKPFVVLMSTRPKTDVLIDDFEENAALLRGTFDFVTKTELCSPATLEFKLRTWNYGLPARHDIQHFVEALSTAIEDVAKTFRSTLKKLSIQDFTYIQSLALQDDGHPLGDYMLWLYGSLLEDLLLQQPQVLTQRQKLDAMEFPTFLPTEEPPSAQLAELYQTAIGGVSGPLGPHPRDAGPASGMDAAQPVPYPHLGDVFVKDSAHDVYMVLNAACDLSFAPHTSRICDLDQAILLIPGNLTPLYEAPSDMKQPRTDLFAVDGQLFRVIWRDDRVFSLPHRDLFGKMEASGHKRRYRLRLPYALMVQQAFASKLTRIGLPTAPPICVAVDVSVYCVDDSGFGRTLCAPVKGGAFVIHRKHKNEFVQDVVLTGKCVRALQDRLEEVAEQQLRVPTPPLPEIRTKEGEIDGRKQAEAEKKQKDRLKKKGDRVRSFGEKHDFWFSLVAVSRPMPSPGEPLVLEDSFLSLFRNGTFVGEPWQTRPMVALNINYGDLRNKEIAPPRAADTAKVAAPGAPVAPETTTPAATVAARVETWPRAHSSGREATAPGTAAVADESVAEVANQAEAGQREDPTATTTPNPAAAVPGPTAVEIESSETATDDPE